MIWGMSLNHSEPTSTSVKGGAGNDLCLPDLLAFWFRRPALNPLSLTSQGIQGLLESQGISFTTVLNDCLFLLPTPALEEVVITDFNEHQARCECERNTESPGSWPKRL